MRRSNKIYSIQEEIHNLETKLDCIHPDDYDSYEAYEDAILDTQIQMSNLSYNLLSC